MDRVKRPAKDTDTSMFYTFICPRVYTTFILAIDMIIVFNKIINNSRPPSWYFSLTRMGNKEFIIVGQRVRGCGSHKATGKSSVKTENSQLQMASDIDWYYFHLNVSHKAVKSMTYLTSQSFTFQADGVINK